MDDNFEITFLIKDLKGHFPKWKHFGDPCHSMWKRCCVNSDPAFLYKALQVFPAQQIADICSRHSLWLVCEGVRPARWCDRRSQIKLSTVLHMQDTHPPVQPFSDPQLGSGIMKPSQFCCERWHLSPCPGQAGESSQAESRGKKNIWGKLEGIKEIVDSVGVILALVEGMMKDMISMVYFNHTSLL